MKTLFTFFSLIFMAANTFCQHRMNEPAPQQRLSTDDMQPILSGFRALFEALTANGISIRPADSLEISHLMQAGPDSSTLATIEGILDRYSLLIVNINPEARVSITDGIAGKSLIQHQWKAFLVKIVNEAGITSPLTVHSENAQPPYDAPRFASRQPGPNTAVTKEESQNRFLQLQPMTQQPLLEHLSGAPVEYEVLKLYSSQAGRKELQFSADAGKGTNDLAFRNTTRQRFNIQKSVQVKLTIKDDKHQSCMASLSIRALGSRDYGLSAYYPLPAARVAAYDEYPDFFFQPQVYRGDGEFLRLAPGRYVIDFSNGPESLVQRDTLDIPEGIDSTELLLNIRYWIRLSALHYFSADHHVHGAGCAHYKSPEQGVDPIAMWRQQAGEDLNIAANLAWGPGWYHQKMFFTGKDEPFSTVDRILHNDVEVSGFPSSHCGHLVLLGLKENDYPGTTRIEQWPSWTGPVLKWAKEQGAVVGYAHSGLGLEPVKETSGIFNLEMPRMDGIGANEFVATVTQNLVDFYSLGDTPAAWELNMLYHTWNCGFKTRLSGETDFPCLTDQRVGQGRSYFKTPSGRLTYAEWLQAIREGTLYVSDGQSHILDLQVNGSSRDLTKTTTSNVKLKISARVVACLSPHQTESARKIALSPADATPYWSLERARIRDSRKVKVECVMNGICIDSAFIEADGTLQDVSFSTEIDKSAWFALRILPSSHSNAIFVELNGQRVVERKSVQWCIDALNRCWEQKSPAIRPEDQKSAYELYGRARLFYQRLLQ